MSNVVKGRCVCGKTGPVKAVIRHAMQCEAYRTAFREDSTQEALDVAWAWRYAQSEQGRTEEADALQDARDLRGLARREHNENALAVSRSRWTDGKGGFADGVPVPMPDDGVIEVHAPDGSARSQVESVTLTGW